MTAQELDRITLQLVSTYHEAVAVGQDGQRRLVQIRNLEMPAGCHPASANVLIVLDETQPKPQMFVSPGQRLSNGRTPKNSANILIAGQTWMQFSFNIPWSDGDNIARFVVAGRQRFAQND
jgi:hypothetical protein